MLYISVLYLNCSSWNKEIQANKKGWIFEENPARNRFSLQSVKND